MASQEETKIPQCQFVIWLPPDEKLDRKRRIWECDSQAIALVSSSLSDCERVWFCCGRHITPAIMDRGKGFAGKVILWEGWIESLPQEKATEVIGRIDRMVTANEMFDLICLSPGKWNEEGILERAITKAQAEGEAAMQEIIREGEGK